MIDFLYKVCPDTIDVLLNGKKQEQVVSFSTAGGYVVVLSPNLTGVLTPRIIHGVVHASFRRDL